MDLEILKVLIEKEYGISVLEVQKIKGIYKIRGTSGIYCLKRIKYDFPHFIFIKEAMSHLQKNGFNNIPTFIKTLSGGEYISLGEYGFGYLNPFLLVRESNYDNPIDVEMAVNVLADLHIKTRGFEVKDYMRPRVSWKIWPETFSTRRDEIIDFKNRIERKKFLTEFDEIYYGLIQYNLDLARRAIDNLEKTKYYELMDEEMKLKGFCHHDFAHHNVLINEEGNISIIDFDYCILDTHLHDLSSILIRVMKNGKWSLDTAKFILDNYNKTYGIRQDEIPVMAAFIQFPQEFWQVGIQYYWEEQRWGEEFFTRKLKKIEEDMYLREEFVREFSVLIYGG